MVALLKSAPKNAIRDAISRLGLTQRFAKQALPDADLVTVELPNVIGADPYARLVVTLKPLADPAESMFTIKRNLVPGVRLSNPMLRAGENKRHVIIANIEGEAA